MDKYVPQTFVERASKYTSEEYVETSRADTVAEGQLEKVWYAAWYLKILNWALKAFLVLLFIAERKIIRQDKWLYNLFCFTYLFYGLSNLMVSIPSGGRFLAIAGMCTVSLLIFYI